MKLIKFLCALVILFAWNNPANANISVDDVEKFIRGLSVSATHILNDENLSEKDRADRFQNIVHNNFAIDNISRFVIGRYWRSMTKEQQNEYQTIFLDWVVKNYSTKLNGYKNRSIIVVKSMDGGNNKDVFVTTNIISLNGELDIRVDWRVRNYNGRYKIIDIVIEGTSMLITQKSEFKSVISRIGIDGLINSLKENIKKLEKNG